MGRQADAMARGGCAIIGIIAGPVILFGGGSLLHAIFGA